ncbi:hypothetical protein VYU27_008276 [Nannochloropsis oceanica]
MLLQTRGHSLLLVVLTTIVLFLTPVASQALIGADHRGLDAGRVFRPLQAAGVTGGEAALKKKQQQQQQQQQSSILSADFDEKSTTTERDTAVAAAGAAKSAGSRAAAAAAAGLPVNVQQQEQLQPPSPRFLAVKKKEQTLPSSTSTSAEAKEAITGSSPSSLLSPSSSSSTVPSRKLQQTIEHLARRSPAPLEPKDIRPVSKKEGSAWAEKTTKKEGRAFFNKFDGEAKSATEDQDEKKKRWKVEVEVSADDKMIPTPKKITEERENLTKKTDQGALGSVGDFLWGSGGGKTQGINGNEVREREEEGIEKKQRVWGSRSKNHDVVNMEEMEEERAAGTVAAKEDAGASAVEREGTEAQEREVSGLEDNISIGSKRMKIGHPAIRVEERGQKGEEETHESIDKKLRQQQGKGVEAEGQVPPSKKLFS